MSDAAAKKNQPTSDPAPSAQRASHNPHLLVWLALLLVAGAAFAGAVYYAGGINGSLDALSSVKLADLMAHFPSFSQVPRTSSTPASATTTSTAQQSSVETTSALLSRAEKRMFTEQLRSQASITSLVQGRIDTIEFGTATVTTSTATIPVHAAYAGSKPIFAGNLVLTKQDGLWFFESIGKTSDGSPGDDINSVAVDSSVVKVISDQQSSPENQRMLTEGILGGGFNKASVVRVSRGAGTATVEMRLSGGSWVAGFGRFVLISKTEAGRTYWFIARLDDE